MRLRQSDLKLFSRCPLAWRFQNLDHAPREQSGSLTFGTLIHAAVLRMEVNRDVEGAVDWFRQAWHDPAGVEEDLEPSYYVRGTSWRSYLDIGERVLRDWWSVVQWERDVVLAREYHFVVPIGDHELEGTLDKLAIRYLGKSDEHVVLVSDLKTTKREPTYGYLAHDLQFTAYCYATTRPEFWEGLPDGLEMFQRCADRRRVGEWVQLLGPKRMDAGERNQLHYNRLRYAIGAVADAITWRIFTPNISGETCLYCDFRQVCGLPSREEEKNLMLGGVT